MASATLQMLLGAKNLCGIITKVKSKLPDYVLPDIFTKPNRTVEGAYATFPTRKGERRSAQEVAYNAPSIAWEGKGLGQVSVKMMHSKHNISIDPGTLTNLLLPDKDMKQVMAREEIARQTADFGDAFTNKRLATTFMTLANGKIYIGANGQLLPTSTGAAFTVDMNIPAGNRNQLKVATPEFGLATSPVGIIAASWATVTTDIPTHIQSVIRASVQLTGYPVTHAFYGSNILQYILKNTMLQSYMKFNPAFNESLRVTGQIPDGFLGLHWHPAHLAFFSGMQYNTRTGEQQDLPYTVWDADTITFCPEPANDWYEFVQGTYPCPNKIRLSESLEDAISDMTSQPGMFSYAFGKMDPPGFTQIAGDTFLPYIKVPEAVFIAKVAF